MGEYWKIYSNPNTGRDFDATETGHGSGLQSENEALRKWMQDLEDDKTAKTGLTTKHLDALKEIAQSGLIHEVAAPTPEQMAALKTIGEKIQMEQEDGTFKKYNTNYMPPESTESYNPLDAKDFKMTDEGDQNYAYWPYIPSSDFFESEMKPEERDDHMGAKKYKIGEHIKAVRDSIDKDKDKSWSCGGF